MRARLSLPLLRVAHSQLAAGGRAAWPGRVHVMLVPSLSSCRGSALIAYALAQALAPNVQTLI